ncbi:MAG: hypothetical protein KGL39_03760 [Patescibacteria group bacterium]|nr:hypothetical protein [Patescibacteria group bacterium]
MSRGRAGRPRKKGDRYPSGDLKPQHNPWLILRRAELSGDPGTGSYQDALGIAVLRGICTRVQRDAGLKYGAAHARWSRICGLPSRTLLTKEHGRHLSPDPSPDSEIKARRAWDQAQGALLEAGIVAKLAVEITAIQDIFIPDWAKNNTHPGAQALQRGLRILSDYFGLADPDDRAAA